MGREAGIVRLIDGLREVLDRTTDEEAADVAGGRAIRVHRTFSFRSKTIWCACSVPTAL